jgi:replicative DNA helicase
MLANDVRFLVHSLGGVTATQMRRTKFSYLGEKRIGAESARISIRFPGSDIVPVASAKNIPKWNSNAGTLLGRAITGVTHIGTRPCQCIRVDAHDSLYVTDGFIVTHNTALAMQIAAAAGDSGVPVLVISLEMARRQLEQRRLADEAAVDLRSILTGDVTADEIKRLTRVAAGRFEDRSIFIDDPGSMNIVDVRVRARKFAADQSIPRKGLIPGLIIIDYLQLVKPTPKQRFGNREGEVADVSHGLKALSKEVGMPVLVLAQMNRDVEKRPDKKPQMSDLRESGAIEADADAILFLHRDDVYRAEDDANRDGMADVFIRKNRNGPSPLDVRMRFAGAYTRFESVSKRDDGPPTDRREPRERIPGEDDDT